MAYRAVSCVIPAATLGRWRCWRLRWPSCMRRQPGTTLTRVTYDSFGGVQGAIARRADTTYGALAEAAQRALGEVFKELVEVDPERGIPTRKRAPLARFADTPAAQQLIERFVE